MKRIIGALGALFLSSACGLAIDSEDPAYAEDSTEMALTVPVVTIQAESMNLTDYEVVDNAHIKLTAASGSAGKRIAGDDSDYELTIHVITEMGGTPLLEVFQDNNPIGQFTYQRKVGTQAFVIDRVRVGKDTRFRLVGHREGTARARVDRLVFRARTTTPPPTTTPTPPSTSSPCEHFDATLTHYASFETAELAGTKDKLYPGGTVSFTTQASRAGAGAVRMRVGDPKLTPAQCTEKRYRAEVLTSPKQLYGWDDGKTYWIGVSINPTQFDGSAYSLLQVHAPVPDADACDYAGNAVTILPQTINGVEHYTVRVIENGGRTPGGGSNSGTVQVWAEPMAKNAWTDFVLGFSLSTQGKGFFEIWRDGELVYQKSGLTNVNYIDACGTVIPPEKRAHYGVQLGVYGPSCLEGATATPFREVLMDELRTATGSDGFALVHPGCYP